MQVTVPVTINGLEGLTATFDVPESGGVIASAPEIYESTQELRNTLAITKGAPFTYRDIFRVVIPNGVTLNDKVFVNTQWETTNDYSYNVMVGRFIAANTSLTDAVRADEKITACTENLTPAMHHMVVTQQGFLPPMDTQGQDLVIHAVGYFAANQAVVPGSSLVIEQGYGHLQAAVWRG